MFVVEKTAEFPYTPDQLFGLMSDIRNEVKWMPGVKSAVMTGTHPVGAGTEFVTVYQGFGTMRIRLTEFAAPRMFACVVSGTPMDMNCRFEYEPTATGTRMHMRMEVIPHGVLRLIQPILKWMFTREIAKRPAQIRRGLEILYPRL
ncbi:MAG TPA: SRPBCC family protein [Vicinamibacterales bacterium]|nr:SRPBCC family protein [Vicinamibacterales bacterium]